MKKVLEIFPQQPLIILQATLDGHTGEVTTYVLAKEGAVLVGHLQHSGLGNLLPPTVLNEGLVLVGINKAAELGAVLILHLHSITGNLPGIEVPVVLTNPLHSRLAHLAKEQCLY